MEWRNLTQSEKEILAKLLEKDFPGRDAIAQQIEDSLVTEIDRDGSLEFNVSVNTVAVTKYRVPVEAYYQDADGVTVHVLLHVLDGRVKELEIYKDDSSPVIKRPVANQLQVITLNSPSA
jgi:hypothetical protein